MNPNAQKWVDALRSGSYSQIIGSLRDSRDADIGYCCHGVACDLYPKGVWHADDVFELSDGLRAAAMPPDEVQEWVGINEDFANKLAKHNDHGDTFDEIAAMIEDYFA